MSEPEVVRGIGREGEVRVSSVGSFSFLARKGHSPWGAPDQLSSGR